MVDPQSHAKAKLTIDGGKEIECLFNPTEYKISKSNNWTYKERVGMSVPRPEFGGGQPRELSLTILLDSSLLGPGTTVREITDDLFKMMEVPDGEVPGGAKSDPPFLTFQWGTVVTFKAACTSLSAAYQLFRHDGEPIRAEVSMTLKEVGVDAGANPAAPGAQAPGASPAAPSLPGQGPGAASPALPRPSTGGMPGLGLHTIKDGDSLPSIANAAYGNPATWRVIAEVNGIVNPLDLRRGASIVLPKLEIS